MAEVSISSSLDAFRKVDVLVVGAGPTGCTAAIAFAQKGAQVLLVEGNPKAARRFAGEWLHPPGVRALAHLGVDTQRITRSRGSGFVLFAPNEEPIAMPYTRGSSLARVHHEFVLELRAEAADRDGVEYIEGLSFLRFEGPVVILREAATGLERRVVADRVIGADGRASKVRDALGQHDPSEPTSYMMGVDFKDCRLPIEGLGHVLAGGPGPVLLYRVDDETIRGCLDVPHALGPAARKKGAVYEAFLPVMPDKMREAFKRGVAEATPWASTRYRPRTFFGRGRVWLVGDAVGHIHPITGMGMTLGILDAVAASEELDVQHYATRRNSHVVELLTNALYHLLQKSDDSALRVRHGLFEMLRKHPFERRRTMCILTGEDERRSSFVSAFLKASGYSVRTTLRESRVPLSDRPKSLREDLGWLKWPLGAMVSTPLFSPTLRSQSSFSDPLPPPQAVGLSWPPKAPSS